MTTLESDGVDNKTDKCKYPAGRTENETGLKSLYFVAS